MSRDIKRDTELFIVSELKKAALRLPTRVLLGHSFYPYMGGTMSLGGTSTGDADEIEPPFTVVSIEASRVLPLEGTWMCEGTLQILTHAADSTSEEHSTLVRAIYAALDNIAAAEVNDDYSFHGIDISSMTSTTDDSGSCHADIIKFACGVGG